MDAKPGWAGVHGSGHLVKSEYTLPGETGSGSGGSGGPGEAGGPTHILPDTSGQSLPPLMHMGYAVGRHAQVREKIINTLQWPKVKPVTTTNSLKGPQTKT